MSQDSTGPGSFKLYVVPVNRFATSDLPHFKQQLADHKHALNKLEAACDWRAVHQEQFRASATLNKLKRSLQDLEDVKSRLDVSQQPDFEQLLAPVRDKAQKSIDDFVEFLSRIQSAAASAAVASEAAAEAERLAAESDSQQLLQRQLVLDEQLQLQQRREQMEAVENLERDAADLHEMFADLASMTAEQGEQVTLVEDNVITAQENVTEGARQLAAAARLSGTVAPVAGALIGGLVAGPLGLMVGAKVGGMAAVSGGLLGYVGGQMVNKGRRGSGGSSTPGTPPASAESQSAPTEQPAEKPLLPEAATDATGSAAATPFSVPGEEAPPPSALPSEPAPWSVLPP